MKTIRKALISALLLFSFQQAYCLNSISDNKGYKEIQQNDSAKIVRHVSFAPYGIVNIFNNSVTACQVAAVGNISRERSSGFQCAGVFNTANEHNGLQMGGIVNTADKVSGIQIGGILNQTSQGNCVQIAGLVNNSHCSNMSVSESQPIQISGLINNSDRVQVQLTGIANNCPAQTELQIAGIVNHCGKSAGTQLSGVTNYCRESTGVQISGVVNKCSILKGVQIGLVNISDSCKGVPIGLINIVKKNGYFKLEISGDEMFYTNVGLRSGLKQIHTIVLAGLQPDNTENPLWSVGAGIGSLIPVSSKTSLGIDAMHQQVYYGHHAGENYLTKFNIGVDHELTSGISVYFGLTYNFLFTDKDYNGFENTYDNIAPYYFTENTFFNNNVKSWAGFKLGIRLF
ncbi:MAG TPA: hypothetical protein PKM69_01305 [Bacteroidales bacterium]|nr:hypothetical protein [Bacteroidales bacterium]